MASRARAKKSVRTPTKRTRTGGTRKPGKAKPREPAKGRRGATAPKQTASRRGSAARRSPSAPKVRVDYASPALAGHLEALARLTGASDRLAYKWLQAAADAGHDVAQPIATLLDTSSLRDDVDRYEIAAAHWELACAYLEGSEGLPLDLELAQHHLAKAFERHDLASINAHTQSTYSPATLLLKLTGDAWKTLETALVSIPNADA